MSYWRLVACVLAAGALHASDLQGLVRDLQGQPVANVRVQLRTGSQTFTAVTDTTGGSIVSGISRRAITRCMPATANLA